MCRVRVTSASANYQSYSRSISYSAIPLFCIPHFTDSPCSSSNLLSDSLSTKAYSELLHLLAAHLPVKAKVPKTIRALKQFFIDVFPELQLSEHWYCSCGHRILQTASQLCGRRGCENSRTSHFISVPLEHQLKRKLEGRHTLLISNVSTLSVSARLVVTCDLV